MEDITDIEHPAPEPHAASELRPLFDWTQCVVGGSFALQQYLREPWIPNDIDVMCKCGSVADLEAIISRVKDGAPNTTVSPVLVITPEIRSAKTKEDPDYERFHESIIATCKMAIPGIPLPVEVVALNPRLTPIGDASIIEHLNRITDLPACVSYNYYADGTRHFHVPKRALRALERRVIKAFNICASRKAKYAARGFTFEE